MAKSKTTKKTDEQRLPDDLPPFDSKGPNLGDLVSIQVNDNEVVTRELALVVDVKPDEVLQLCLKFTGRSELYWAPQICVDLESKAE